MADQGPSITVRDCAQAIIGVIDRCGSDGARLLEGLRAPVTRLLQRPDLLTQGVKREGNHIDFSRYLYYDGQLSITLDNFPRGKRIPPHDHGVWELLAIYSGRVDHTVYERLDDGSVEGYADLKVVDDRVLEAKDLAIVALPAEIHAFTALTDDTFSVTIVGGHYKPDRYYFKPEEKSCVLRAPKALRATA